MTDYKQLCAELLAALEEEASNWNLDPECHPLVVRARAALAEPEPKGPTDKDLSDLWSWAAGQDQGPWPTQQHCFARAVLARWGNRQGILDRSTLQPPACQPHFSKSDQLMQNLNQHNQQKLTKFQLNTQSRLNGISCPECQHELMDSNPSVCLASWPPQYRVHCPNCGYIGCRY